MRITCAQSCAPLAHHCFECVPPCVIMQEVLVALQGRDQVPDMVVRMLDTHKSEWSYVHPTGSTPPQRGGHTVRLCLPSSSSLETVHPLNGTPLPSDKTLHLRFDGHSRLGCCCAVLCCDASFAKGSSLHTETNMSQLFTKHI